MTDAFSHSVPIRINTDDLYLNFDNFLRIRTHLLFVLCLSKAHLLVQCDVVDPDPRLSSEIVGAVVAVLQHGPAVR